MKVVSEILSSFIRCKMFRLVAAIFLLFTSTCHSATITDSPADKNPDIGFLVVLGELKKGDAQQFNTSIQKYSKGVVLFESGGGDLATGLEIGTTIRLKGFRTGVAAGAMCASSCALAWLGGVERFLAPSSKLGFHAAYRIDGNAAYETGLGNAVVGAYLTRIGLPLDAVIYITKAAPDQMTWLTPADAKKAGIDFTIFSDGPTKSPESTAKMADLPPATGSPQTAYVGPIPAGPPTSAPSFDCGQAIRDDEKAICGDAILARADVLISTRFRSLSKSSDDSGTRYWLRINNAYRENCHLDILCILSVQIRSLRIVGGSIPPSVEGYKAELTKSGIGSEWKAILPTSIGECINTSIVGISDRFGSPLTPHLNADGFDSGSAADFRNGGHVISYSKQPALLNARKGDRVRMCLVSIPKNCPPGDDRGRNYRIINLRTKDTVTMADAQHMCGGA